MPLIAIDAMGGDHVPSVPVQGAFRALENNPDLKIILVRNTLMYRKVSLSCQNRMFKS